MEVSANTVKFNVSATAYTKIKIAANFIDHFHYN